ncbi:hypothetical protein [Paenibacillus sp. IITD108]|uniref:hypothetical protein n=1 Tax=Paenibacillus sp. IITD108 TaxID=3116649 RepID=UPI002F42BC70
MHKQIAAIFHIVGDHLETVLSRSFSKFALRTPVTFTGKSAIQNVKVKSIWRKPSTT